jgi:hypothetical protein
MRARLSNLVLITLDQKKLPAKMFRFRKWAGDLTPLCGIEKDITDA